jgi:hypothetical protein
VYGYPGFARNNKNEYNNEKAENAASAKRIHPRPRKLQTKAISAKSSPNHLHPIRRVL